MIPRGQPRPVRSQKARVCTVGAPAEIVYSRLDLCLLLGGDRDSESGPQRVSREEPGEEVLGCINSFHSRIQVRDSGARWMCVSGSRPLVSHKGEGRRQRHAPERSQGEAERGGGVERPAASPRSLAESSLPQSWGLPLPSTNTGGLKMDTRPCPSSLLPEEVCAALSHKQPLLTETWGEAASGLPGSGSVRE